MSTDQTDPLISQTQGDDPAQARSAGDREGLSPADDPVTAAQPAEAAGEPQTAATDEAAPATEPGPGPGSEPRAEPATGPAAQADAKAAPDQAEGETKEKEDDIEVAYEVTDEGPCRKKVAITIEHRVFDAEMDKQLTELAQTVVTPGFRKGRAPRRIIEKRYAKALAEEVRRNLAVRGLQKALTEAGLDPLGEPEMGEIEMEGEGPLTTSIVTDVRPTVTIKDYKGLEIKRRAVSVGDKEVDRALAALLERRGRLMPIVDPEATVGGGDLPVCDYTLTAGDRTLLERTDVTVPMALKHFPEVPELGTDRLLGAKAGDAIETTFELTSDAWPEEVRGQQATLAVRVHEIKRLELPELTPELLEEFGAKSEEHLRANLEMMLLRDQERAVQEDVEDQLRRQLLEQADFDLPESLVAAQAARAVEQTRLRLMQLGVEPETLDKRAEEMASHGRDRALKSLKMQFILNYVADQEQIEAEPADVERRVARIAANYGLSPRQARLQLEKEGALDALGAMIREEKTLDWLLEHAQVTQLAPEVGFEAAAPEST